VPKDDIAWAVECIDKMRDTYETCQAYYDGDQPLLFATEKFRNAFGTLFTEFSDNLCPTVVEALSDRLKVTGWDGDSAKQVQKFWDKWRLDRVQSQVHRTSPMKGDAYVLVWPNKDNEPKFWPHEPDQVCVDYDDEDDPSVILKAGKVWQDDDEHFRCTLYYDDHVEKYRTIGPEKSGAAPAKVYRWTTIGELDNPWERVPMFHFGNGAEIGCMGVSRLKDVMPVQDALNKSVLDLLVAMEFVAMPQRYATGLQVEVDEDTGKPKSPPFTPGVDRIWTAAGDVKFGEFSQATLTQFVEVQNSLRLEMARISGTPPHFLSLEDRMPSGEALKVSEGRLIKKIESSQTTFTPVWIEMMVFAASIESATIDPDKITPIWAPGSPHNPLLDAETQLVKHQVGVSKKQNLRELGYSEEQIEQMQKDNEEEAAAAMAAQPQLLGPDGKPVTPLDPSGKPTAFNRNGAAGQPSKAAPQQQNMAIKPPKPVAGRGQYAEG
jgi:hypothetical protein